MNDFLDLKSTFCALREDYEEILTKIYDDLLSYKDFLELCLLAFYLKHKDEKVFEKRKIKINFYNISALPPYFNDSFPEKIKQIEIFLIKNKLESELKDNNIYKRKDKI